MEPEKIKVLICGGGNGAHVFAALSSLHFETVVLDLFADEAKRWTDAMTQIAAGASGFTIEEHTPSGQITQRKAHAFTVSKQPQEIVPGSDVIIITVPAFAHQQYFNAIKPYVQDGVIIVGVPGQAGFEFDAKGIIGESVKYNLVNFETLPWACRIKNYGMCVEVLGTKDAIGGVSHITYTPSHVSDAVGVLQMIMGEHPRLKVNDRGHPLAMTLMGLNAYVHTAILYARWKDWDGVPMQEAPLFYQGISEFGAQVMSTLSDEVLLIVKKVTSERPEIDLSSVEHIWDWYIKCYGDRMDDKTTLCTSIKTNHAYEGLKHPMRKSEDGSGLVPDLSNRYFTEDIPMGLVVLRGVAEIAGVPTPMMDEVIEWAQKIMGKEYLVDGKICGKDLESTRAPQKYGFTKVDDILMF